MTRRLVTSAVVFGDAHDAHFRAVAAWLDQHLECRWYADVGSALANAGKFGDCEPALVVLLQSRLGQFTAAELEMLGKRWPLARRLAVVASFPEGEPRTGPSLPGVCRVPWHAAVERLAREFPVTCGPPRGERRGGIFDLPATATLDERLLAESQPASALASVVAIAARRVSSAEPLIDALAAAGIAAFYWPLDRGAAARGVDAVVWDVAGCEHQLSEFSRRLPGDAARVPVVALVDFPRPDDRALLADLGVRRVLGKPLLIADLVACLDALLASAEDDAGDATLPRAEVA